MKNPVTMTSTRYKFNEEFERMLNDVMRGAVGTVEGSLIVFRKDGKEVFRTIVPGIEEGRFMLPWMEVKE